MPPTVPNDQLDGIYIVKENRPHKQHEHHSPAEDVNGSKEVFTISKSNTMECMDPSGVSN